MKGEDSGGFPCSLPKSSANIPFYKSYTNVLHKRPRIKTNK